MCPLVGYSDFLGFGFTTLMEQLYKNAKTMMLENSLKIAHIYSSL